MDIGTDLDGVVLRRARVEDAADYAAMMNDPGVFPGVLQLPWSDAASWHDRLAAPGGPGVADLHLVAVYEHHLVGAAGLHSAGSHVRRRHAMGIGMVVARPWQGRGIGTMLLAALCDHADRWIGALRPELTVYTDNAVAIALYRRRSLCRRARDGAPAPRSAALGRAMSAPGRSQALIPERAARRAVR